MTDNKNESIIMKIVSIPAILGIIIGFLAALFQVLFGSAGGPEAYGFCVACHTRDLTDTLINAFLPENGGISLFAALPVLTPAGILIGGYFSSKENEEFRIKKSDSKTNFFYLLGGILIMWFGLFLGACPYRAALRAGYGDVIALLGIFAIFFGVFIGTRIVLFKMNKEEM